MMKIQWRMRAMIQLVVMLSSLYAFPGLGTAERPETKLQQQQEMNKIMDMLKQKGMPPEQMQQMQKMLKDMEGQGRKQSSIRLKKKQQQFEAKTKGNGTAQVEVEGKRYDLTILKCEITDRNAGRFSIHAQQAPGLDKGDLWIGGGGGHAANNTVQFISHAGLYEAGTNSPTFQLKGKTLKWEGPVVREGKTVPLKFQLTCGSEMKDYATPSRAKPKNADNVLTLQLGQELHTFQAGRCSTKKYRTGNLVVQFEATATGAFRGRPAMVLLSKSHPVGSTQIFQDMDLLLGELTPEQRILSPLKVVEQLNKDVEIFSRTENASIQKKYEKKIAVWQKRFDKDMPALKKQYGKIIPPEKMNELMDPFNKLMDAQGEEMDKVKEQVKAMRFPKARSFGAITVKGQEIHFGGSKLSTSDAARAPEFTDLAERTELWLTCGE